MAKKSATRLAYEKEIKLLKRRIKSAEKKGYSFEGFTFNENPPRVTKKMVSEIKGLRREKLYSKATVLTEDAEVVSGKEYYKDRFRSKEKRQYGEISRDEIREITREEFNANWNKEVEERARGEGYEWDDNVGWVKIETPAETEGFSAQENVGDEDLSVEKFEEVESEDYFNEEIEREYSDFVIEQLENNPWLDDEDLRYLEKALDDTVNDYGDEYFQQFEDVIMPDLGSKEKYEIASMIYHETKIRIEDENLEHIAILHNALRAVRGYGHLTDADISYLASRGS